MPVNDLVIKEKFAFARKYLDFLADSIETPEEEFLRRVDLQLQGERLFEILSQVVLDVCTHVIANSELDPPASYAEWRNSPN